MSNAQKASNDEDDFSTLNQAINSVKSGIETLAAVLDDSLAEIKGDIIEPLETYSRLQ